MGSLSLRFFIKSNNHLKLFEILILNKKVIDLLTLLLIIDFLQLKFYTHVQTLLNRQDEVYYKKQVLFFYISHLTQL
jgi:hypothetical protein